MNGDLVLFALGGLRRHRLRAFLSMVGVAIGVGAVLLLTSVGEGTRRYVLEQFTQFGTNLLAVNPGKTETMGIPGVLGGTTRKLTLDDAEALRRVPGVVDVVPVVMGMARVEARGRGRSVYVFGVTAAMPRVWRFTVRQGRFLPPGDPRRGHDLAVLGPTLKRELFGETPALGAFVRIAGRRLRVIGILAPKGQMLGFDLDDCAYMPVATALRLFHLEELHEVDVLFAHARFEDRVVAGVRRVLRDRHGREDFTLTTQSAMLESFDNVMRVLTLAVGGIAGLSLLVGALGILTLMWIAVRERTAEIGVFRALGATPNQIFLLFLCEAAGLSAAGGLLGVLGALGLAAGARLLVPGLPVETPWSFVGLALGVSLLTGLLAGTLPARRAAGLTPVVALQAE